MRKFMLLLIILSITAVRAEEQDSVFRALDITIDSGTEMLGAYQIEIKYSREHIKITGIERGENKAFAKAPYYDRRGLSGGRIILAAIADATAKSTTGKTRVARLHLMIASDKNPDFTITPVTAVNSSGKRIKITVTTAQPATQKKEKE